MPDIQQQIDFDATENQQISDKKASDNFSFNNWGDSDLENIRVAIRRFYRNEQGAKCAYCKQAVSLISASNCHVEHIAPKSLYQSFMFEPKNLCVICADCNEVKRNQETINEVPDTVISRKNPRVRYPTTSNAFKIIHPHFDNYDEHIEIFSEKIFVNKSKKGLFTIGACDLNRWIRIFGWEKPTYNDATISSIMNKFLSSNDSMDKIMALKDLKEILLFT